MSDVVTCPGCAAVVDRDEHLLCPACHWDLTGVLQATTATVEAVPAPAAPAPLPAAASWACASPGCEHNPPLAASVSACPFCLEPRPAVTAAARNAEGRYELRDESGAIVVELAGPGPWRLGRGEADSRELAGCMTVSRTHALLARRSSGLAVRDLGSSNHTFVGAVALQAGEERILEPGATLGLGKTVVLHVHAA